MLERVEGGFESTAGGRGGGGEEEMEEEEEADCISLTWALQRLYVLAMA